MGIEQNSKDLVKIQGVDLQTSKEMTFYVSLENLFTSQGAHLDKSIVQVESTKVNHIDTAAKLKDLSIAHYIASEESIVKPDDMRGTKVPNGNLAHVFFSILGEMNLLSQFPIDSTHAALNNFKAWKKVVKGRLHDLDVAVNPEFFHQLYINFKHANTADLQSEENLWKLMRITYNKTPKQKDHQHRHHHHHHQHLFFKQELAKKTLTWDEFKSMLCEPFVKKEDTIQQAKSKEAPKMKKH